MSDNKEKIGIENLKQMLDLALKGVEVVDKSLEDGKVDIQDTAYLMGLIPVLQPAFTNVSKIPAEIKDLDEAEAKEIATHVMSKLSVDNEKAIAIVNYALHTVAYGYFLAREIKA